MNLLHSYTLQVYDMETYFTAQIIEETGPNRTRVWAHGEGVSKTEAVKQAYQNFIGRLGQG